MTKPNIFKKGDKVKVISKTNYADGNNYIIGEVYTVITVGNPYFVLQNKNGVNGNSIHMSNFQKDATNIDELEAEIKYYKKEIKDISDSIIETESKIQYLKETGQKELDENEFKAYHILSLLDKKGLTKLEKAKLISNLVK